MVLGQYLVKLKVGVGGIHWNLRDYTKIEIQHKAKITKSTVSNEQLGSPSNN